MTDNALTRFNPFRIIPCLLVKGGGLVKTERFRKSRYLGDVLNALRIFNEKEVDEIVVLDIEATRLGRPPDMSLISELASECFMPLAYGGGISTAEQAREIIRAGVEKVVLNTAAFDRPSLVSEIASSVGSQSVVVSFDVARSLFGRRKLMTNSGRRATHLNLEEALATIERAGAGEILLQSIDRDGTLAGYDLDLIRAVTQATRLPVVAAGGASSAVDLVKAVKSAGASAVAAGALFVYQGPHRAVLISYPTPADLHNALQLIGG